MTSKAFFEQIEEQYIDQLPFVAYRKPNEAQLKSILQNNSTLHVIDDYTENGFVFAPFDSSQKSILLPLADSVYIETNDTTSGYSQVPPRDASPSKKKKDAYLNLVKKAIDSIDKEVLKKVVVSRQEIVPISDNNPITTFVNLLNTYDTAFVYCWYHPKVGLWLGATPETLLKIDGRRLYTMSLAGTQRFEGTLDVDWQPKERDEQQIVTDYIIQSLETVEKEIHVSDTETIRAGNLLHLKTEISINYQSKTLNLQQIIQNLHPTPAICGLPKNIAKQFILENEDYHREYYTGFLGELNFREKTSRNSNRRNVENNAYTTIKTISYLYVNLRCMQLQNSKAIIYVGGGITKDSDPENEWEETVSKSKVIKSILSL